MNQSIILPANVTIAGEIVFQCKGVMCDCPEVVRIPIEDIVKDGEGGDLSTIEDQYNETTGRCGECRFIYLRDMAYEDSLLD